MFPASVVGPPCHDFMWVQAKKCCNILPAELHYLRDRTGPEVDFLVSAGKKPWFAVEAKWSETRIDTALVYFREKLGIPWAYQVVLEGSRDFVERGVRCLPAPRFLAGLL